MGSINSTLKQRSDDVIIAHIPLARSIARKFASRGEDLDDLIQVALLELVRAASRFDPAHRVPFAQYVYPCILGALKRHFRDFGWRMRVSRRTQELHMQTNHGMPLLTQMLGRTPTIAELAVHLRLSEKDTRAGVESYYAYRPVSLSQPVGDDEDELGNQLGSLDKQVEGVPDRHSLAQYVSALPVRERQILKMRFTGDLCQREIAEQLGISQMHVSRLLSRSIDRLRGEMVTQR